MSDQPELRIGDSHRQAAIEELRSHMEAGRLTIDEFSHRMEIALAAKTQSSLDQLFTDLPADPNAVAGISVWRAADVSRRPSAASPVRVAQRWMIIAAPFLMALIFTGWSFWWAIFIVWGAIFFALTRIERRQERRHDPKQLGR